MAESTARPPSARVKPAVLLDEEVHPALPEDGRLARGERTREVIAAAMIDLICEGDPTPTARRVAERAGVSLRLVFHHFEDVESLYAAAADLQARRHWHHLRPVAADRPLTWRIETLVAQRATIYQAVSPVRRATARLEDSSPTIRGRLALLRGMLREQAAATFAPELSALGDPDRARCLDAIELALSWASWDELRRHLHLGAVAARKVVEGTLAALLSPLAAETNAR